jgi:pantoate--beta-alanine ligase
MRVIATVAELVGDRRAWASTGDIGFVPTMGYLHAGHLSLIQRARAENAVVVASIFVNPAQFGPREDLSHYPRDLPRDLILLEEEGADVVFTPAPKDLYPTAFATYVDPVGALAQRLEAASRPGHFRGVATVVAKLFNLVRPDRAYFGQKDAQQAAVIRQMVADLNFPVDLCVLPTVREADGLAMSSRNSYLGPEDRAAAAALYHALQAGVAAFDARLAGGSDAVRRAMAAALAAEPRVTLDYADLCDPDTFEPLAVLRAPALLSLAARVGPTRLIDNALLRADDTGDLGVRLAE